MSRGTQLSHERIAELRVLIAGGASHESAAQQLGVSTSSVTWRLKTLGLKTKNRSGRAPSSKIRNPRIPGESFGLRKGESEFGGQETRYCSALDRGTPEPFAATLAGFADGAPEGVYKRWKERKGRQL